MTTREDPVRVLLLAAANQVDRYGLLKGDYWPGCRGGHATYVEGDPCCTYGAVDIASARVLTVSTAGARLHALRRVQAHLGVVDLAEWNDAPERTKDEVVAALRAAAA